VKYDGHEVIAAGYPTEQHIQRKIYTDFAWNLMDVCNYKCTYCNMGYGNDESRPSSIFFKDDNIKTSWREVIKKLKEPELPDFVVSLLGGEPTLHPHILEIVSDLETIDNCVAFDLITNASKPFSFFEKLSNKKLTKLNLISSIHFEYATHKLLSKLLKIHSDTSLKLYPVIMLHDNKKYWPLIHDFLHTFSDQNIKYNVTFLENAYGYKPRYTREFYKSFSDYLPHGFMKALIARSIRACDSTPGEKYQIITDNNTTHSIDIKDIYKNNIRRFKGWKCTPKSWMINTDGSIKNICTGKNLSITNNECNQRITCPNDICNHKSLWNYEKFKSLDHDNKH
jgi:organic radical activating enzyme